MTYRLLAGADDDIDRILFNSAAEWGIEAAGRYDRLILVAFNIVGAAPDTLGALQIDGVPGVRAFPLRLVRHLTQPALRVGRPRHLVVYRVAADGVVEIIGLAHDRMHLPRAARRMQREGGQ